jgi:hypothetical protein
MLSGVVLRRARGNCPFEGFPILILTVIYFKRTLRAKKIPDPVFGLVKEPLAAI